MQEDSGFDYHSLESTGGGCFREDLSEFFLLGVRGHYAVLVDEDVEDRGGGRVPLFCVVELDRVSSEAEAPGPRHEVFGLCFPCDPDDICCGDLGVCFVAVADLSFTASYVGFVVPSSAVEVCLRGRVP